jgi:hypothetical protein
MQRIAVWPKTLDSKKRQGSAKNLDGRRPGDNPIANNRLGP